MQPSQEIYDSANRPPVLIEEIQALIKYKDLVQQTISRSIKTRYKRSALGVVWSMLNPLLTMVVMAIVFSSIFRFSVEYYPVYILSGLLIWNLFSTTTSGAMADMLFNGTLITLADTAAPDRDRPWITFYPGTAGDSPCHPDCRHLLPGSQPAAINDNRIFC
jgi:hypothetical protein